MDSFPCKVKGQRRTQLLEGQRIWLYRAMLEWYPHLRSFTAYFKNSILSKSKREKWKCFCFLFFFHFLWTVFSDILDMLVFSQCFIFRILTFGLLDIWNQALLVKSRITEIRLKSMPKDDFESVISYNCITCHGQVRFVRYPFPTVRQGILPCDL